MPKLGFQKTLKASFFLKKRIIFFFIPYFLSFSLPYFLPSLFLSVYLSICVSFFLHSLPYFSLPSFFLLISYWKSVFQRVWKHTTCDFHIGDSKNLTFKNYSYEYGVLWLWSTSCYWVEYFNIEGQETQ